MNTADLTGKEAVGILGMTTASLFICIACLVLLVIAWWKIFKKAGEPGWKSIVPIYSSYTQFKMTWKTSIFWIWLVLTAVVELFKNLNGSTALDVIGGILTIPLVIITIMQLHKLSKAFGHGIGFTLGLIFLNPIFALILGFGSSKYIGAQN